MMIDEMVACIFKNNLLALNILVYGFSYLRSTGFCGANTSDLPNGTKSVFWMLRWFWSFYSRSCNAYSITSQLISLSPLQFNYVCVISVIKWSCAPETFNLSIVNIGVNCYGYWGPNLVKGTELFGGWRNCRFKQCRRRRRCRIECAKKLSKQ